MSMRMEEIYQLLTLYALTAYWALAYYVYIIMLCVVNNY